MRYFGSIVLRLYNEAHVDCLKGKLEFVHHMEEDDSLDEYIAHVKDLHEQLIDIDEILSDSYLV